MTEEYRIGFVRQQFPLVSETFVLEQMHALKAAGLGVRMYAERKAKSGLMHVRAAELMRDALFATQKSSIFASLRPRRLSAPVERWMRDRAMTRLLKQALEECNLLLCHFGPTGIAAAEAARGMKSHAPIWTVFHGFDVSSFPRQRGPEVYKNLFLTGDRFIAISEFWVHRLIELGCPAQKIQVLHMGVDLSALPFQPRERNKGQPATIVSVGRLVEKKGTAFTLSALSEVRRSRPDLEWRFHLVGDGPLEAELKAQTDDLGIADRVVFHGRQSADQVAALLIGADLFVLPSVTALDGDMEGIPVALMEAMAIGVPVIATKHSGIPELIINGVTGYLAPERDVSGLSRLLVDAMCLSGPKRHEMQSAARATVERDFDANTLANTLKDWIDSAL